MTDPVSLSLAGTAAAIALAAGWLSLPKPPPLRSAQWFTAVLATVLRGEEEAAGGDVESWEARVLSTVRHHPAVDDAAPWLTQPNGLPLHAGQADLIQDLRDLTSVTERAKRLFVTDPAAREAAIGDPAALGAAYDPARLLVATAGWDAVADWGAGDSDAVMQAMSRSLGATWAVVGSDGAGPAVLDALVALGGQRVFGEDLVEALSELAPTASDRLIIAVTGDVLPLLDALSQANGLRDRVLAVVAVGADVLAEPGSARERRQDWLGAHFTHTRMNLEAHRSLYALSVQWFDPDNVDAMVRGRFPQPADAGMHDAVLVAEDMGLLAVEPPPPASAIAKALWLTTGLVVLNGHRPG